MEIAIGLNPKHETYQVTAFFDVLANSGHAIVLVYNAEDLVNPDEPPSLENLGVKKHIQNQVHRIVFAKEGGIVQELYKRPM
jgi:hypothetical protein